MSNIAKKKARLQELYDSKISKELKAELGVSSSMEIPRLAKISVNVGAGIAVSNPKIMDTLVTEMAMITGQAPVKTRARIAIAGFKIRENLIIGAKVTLRGKQMYEFLDRLISVALPRVRDFNGISRKGFDSKGNYTLGVKEQIIFPEIDFDKVEYVHGYDITFVIKNKSKEHSEKLLEKFGFPFKKK